MLVGVSIVRNEADIIEAMLRHNLRFLDRIHVIDNGSTDATPEILDRLARDTGALSCTVDAHLGFRQMGALNRVIEELGASRGLAAVVPLDADEFIRGDPASFRAQVTGTREPLHYCWQTYVPRPGDDPAEPNPVRRIRHRRRSEPRELRKVILPAALIGQAKLQPGSHGLRHDGRDLASRPLEGIALAHFPVRSRDQLMAKVLIGAWNLRLRGARRNIGTHWREMTEEIVARGGMDDDLFYRFAQAFQSPDGVEPSELADLVEDPLWPGDWGRDIAIPPEVPALAKLLRFTDALVTRCDPHVADAEVRLSPILHD